MKPTMTFDETVLDNQDVFTDPFYDRYPLRHAPAPITLTDNISKNYLFPTYYGDVTCAIAIFMCPYEKAQALLPHPKMKPVPMTRGRAAVAFSCYIYRQVLGVPPYNEIAMTIPVLIDPGVKVPLLPLVTNFFPNFGYYVFSMPVTSEENRLRGVNIWGLPKVTQEIDIHEEDGDCVTVAKEADATPYFTLRVPTTGTPTDFDVTSNLYSRLGNDLKQSPTAFKATFNVNKNMGQLFKKNQQPDRTYLELGDTPSGQVLKDLQLEPAPFQTRYAARMQSCFDLPNEKYEAPFGF
jgi:hypothetical protein